MTHLYTLIVKSDNTYEVRIDNKKAESGNLEDDWDFLPPKTVKDPEASKPDEWDDNEKIDDPETEQPDVSCWEITQKLRQQFLPKKLEINVFKKKSNSACICAGRTPLNQH